jgi:hypothetical protein
MEKIMTESDVLRSVASSGGSALASVVVAAAAEMYFYPEKYGAGSISRLEAIKTSYREIYTDMPIPGIWTLSEDNRPYQMLPEGMNWESYVNSRMRDRKTTDLTVVVKTVLQIISNFLDKRRLEITKISSIQKGDVEELFFGEIINWLIDVLDGNVDENLAGKIEKRRKYLNSVFGNPAIFRAQFFSDQSPSRPVIDDIVNILEQSLSEAQRFTLNKFQDITREARVIHYHFLRGFSYLSETLKDVGDLENNWLLKAIKNNSKISIYTKFFLLFIEKTTSRKESEFEQFDPIEVSNKMTDEGLKKMGVWAEVGEALEKSIPDIFAAAYNVLVVMRLISLASTTISEHGTTHLFCNEEGRDYFLFLLEDFRSELNIFVDKLSTFNEEYIRHSKLEVRTKKKNATKENSMGQYLRVGGNFESILKHKKNLLSYLESAATGIREFNRRTPEESWRRKEELYNTIRKRMYRKGAGQIADRLERFSRVRLLQVENVSDNKSEVLESSIAAGDRESQADRGKLEQISESITAAAVEHSNLSIDEEKNNGFDSAAEQNSRLEQEQASLLSSENLPDGAETYKKLVEKQTTFLRKKIKSSLKSLAEYENETFEKFFRSKLNIGLISELRKIFEHGIKECPEIDLHPTELPIFYDQLSMFITNRLQDEESTNEHMLKNKVAKKLYFIASALKVIFDRKEYRHLTSVESKGNMKLKCAFQESVKLLEQQNEVLLSYREKSKERERNMQVELDNLQEIVEDQKSEARESENIIHKLNQDVSELRGRCQEKEQIAETHGNFNNILLARMDAQDKKIDFLLELIEQMKNSQGSDNQKYKSGFHR